jgi:hypothetical protein
MPEIEREGSANSWRGGKAIYAPSTPSAVPLAAMPASTIHAGKAPRTEPAQPGLDTQPERLQVHGQRCPRATTLESTAVLRAAPVAMFVNVTAAPGTTAPCESLMVPNTEPVSRA